LRTDRDFRGHQPGDEAIALDDGLLPEDLQGLTEDDIAAILSSADAFEVRHDRLVGLRNQLETLSHAGGVEAGGVEAGGAGDFHALIGAVEAALQRLEHGRTRSGGRFGAGLDPDGRTDACAPEDLLNDDWRLATDPTHRR